MKLSDIDGRLFNASENRTEHEAVDAEMQTTVLVADDHLLLAEAVARALSSKPRCFQTHIAGTLDETLGHLRSDVQFDLVLLDIRMPGMMGLNSVERVISAAAPGLVVLMSGQADRAFVQSTIEKGARGIIPKTLPLKSLASAIDFVLSGQIFIPVDGFGETWNAEPTRSGVLNDREVGIIRLLAEGQTNKEIANFFDITEMSTKMHMRFICRKLNARNRAHVVMVSKERGLI
jgi:two-component system nitrate/nitrite response regulator NarP